MRGHRYAVFDVETPNARNDRMSSIGVQIIEGGRLGESFCSLVDPETHFDAFNVRLTGISEARVAGAPTFGALWQSLRPLFEGAVLVAHNAPFDMGVLAKCLAAYDIFWKPSVTYACTCAMARRALPELPTKRLDALCAHFDIPLDHHDAASDARAAAELLLIYGARGIDPTAFFREYALPFPRGER